MTDRNEPRDSMKVKLSGNKSMLMEQVWVHINIECTKMRNRTRKREKVIGHEKASRETALKGREERSQTCWTAAILVSYAFDTRGSTKRIVESTFESFEERNATEYTYLTDCAPTFTNVSHVDSEI